MREFAKEIDVSFVKIEEVIGAGKPLYFPIIHKSVIPGQLSLWTHRLTFCFFDCPLSK